MREDSGCDHCVDRSVLEREFGERCLHQPLVVGRLGGDGEHPGRQVNTNKRAVPTGGGKFDTDSTGAASGVEHRRHRAECTQLLDRFRRTDPFPTIVIGVVLGGPAVIAVGQLLVVARSEDPLELVVVHEATTPSSCNDPISAGLRPSTSARMASVCSPRRGAGVGSTGSLPSNATGDPGVR